MSRTQRLGETGRGRRGDRAGRDRSDAERSDADRSDADRSGEGAPSFVFDPDRSAQSSWKALRFAYRVSWRLSRPRTLAMMALPLVQGLLPAVLAVTVRGLVNAVISGEGARDDIRQWILIGLAVAVTMAATVPIQRTLELINTEHLERHLVVRLVHHADRLHFSMFEDPSLRDNLTQVQQVPGAITSNLLDKCSRAIAALMTLISLTAVYIIKAPPKRKTMVAKLKLPSTTPTQ